MAARCADDGKWVGSGLGNTGTLWRKQTNTLFNSAL
jgi:hypothetical protein